MATDRDGLKNLDQAFDEHVANDRTQAEAELNQKIMEARVNSSNRLTKNDLQIIENNFWKERQPQLDDKKSRLESEMYKDYGGNKESAQKQTLEYEREKLREAYRQPEPQKNRYIEEQSQQEQRDEDTKKKKEKQLQIDEQKKQQNLEQTKERESDLRRDNLRKQYNDRSSPGLER